MQKASVRNQKGRKINMNMTQDNPFRIQENH